MGLTSAKPLSEQLREHKRQINRSIRELDKERGIMQNEEKKIIAEIKKTAAKNQMGAVKVMAKDLVRTRFQIQKLYEFRSQLQGVALRLQTVKSTQAMTEAMKGITKALVKMNDQVKLPALQEIMKEYMRESEKMNLTEEVMNDAIEDTMTGAQDLEEEERIVSQVLDEIGVDIDAQLYSAPGSSPMSTTVQTKVSQKQPVAEGGQNEAPPGQAPQGGGPEGANTHESNEDSLEKSLEERLNQLKK
eukprot:GHVL01008210.1.p1 GENE.GHVL01008210.1~~GHVL01008210.1.p1  ORF type:complete len:272 (-),score=68.32 GHVL01008210.1:271-1008(-)